MSDTDPDTTKTALYASKENEVVLRPHVYDGIQEYDQKLPNWWLFTFYIMVVWFVAFWILYYQFDLGSSDEAQIEAVVAKINEKKDAELQELLKDLDDKSFVTTWATNEVATANGLDAFSTHCIACHGTDLSATMTVAGMDAPIPLPGLPLNDGEWKFGGNPMAVFKMIKDGSPPESTGHNGAKMEVWGNKLEAKTIAEITAYIISKNEAEFAKFAQ
jgi:cytochrome c oxidase cbb3-type subunit 3